MNRQDTVTIRKIPTGVPGLDEVLGGGLPEFSFNIVAGTPGGGKTTLVHQVMFANATKEKPALFFTVLGEPAIKMLRYQQQFGFYDVDQVNDAIHFVNLSGLLVENDLDAVLAEIVAQVEAIGPALVVVDSFRSVIRMANAEVSQLKLQTFLQRLSLHLTSWQATTFLIGEYSQGDLLDNPEFTVADGILWLSQEVDRNAVVRKMQVVKLRGQEQLPGLHTYRITGDGLEIFPRTFGLTGNVPIKKGTRRLPTGVSELDAMLGGGIPSGHSMLVAGPTGAGKSILACHFVSEGLRLGEPAVVAVFEELPNEYADRAETLGMDLRPAMEAGNLEVVYLRPLDLSVDETVHAIVGAVRRTGAKRLAIDSLAGFEMALAPSFRSEFRESLYRMIAALTRLDVTIVSTVEVEEKSSSIDFSSFTISFLADDIVRMRYVPIDGELRRMLMVVKMRGGKHSRDMREYEITDGGIAIGERMRDFPANTDETSDR